MTVPPLVPDWVRLAWSVAGTTTPSLLERKGHHVMREHAATWCRQNPEAASWLPYWDPHVLKRLIDPPLAEALALPPTPDAQ